MRGGGGERRSGGRGARNLSPDPRSRVRDRSRERRPPRRSISPVPRGRRDGNSPGRRRGSPERSDYRDGREFRDVDLRHRSGEMKELDFRGSGGKDMGLLRHGHVDTLGSGPSGLRGPDMLLQSSGFLDNGNASKFYTPPGGSGFLSSNIPLRSADIGGSGFQDREPLGYRDHPVNSLFPPINTAREKAFGGMSSSAIAKDELANMFRDRDPRPSDGLSRPLGVSKLFDEPLEHSVYGQSLISEPIRRGAPSPPARYTPRENAYYDLDRSNRSGQGFLEADSVYKKIQPDNHADLLDRPASSFMNEGFLAEDSVLKKARLDSRGDFRDTLGSSFMDRARDERADALLMNSNAASFHPRHRPLHEDAVPEYRDRRATPEDYARGFGSELDAPRMRNSPRENRMAPFEPRFTVTRRAPALEYRERSRSPHFPDRHIYRQGAERSPGVRHRDAMDVYESPERMSRGKYLLDDDSEKLDRRRVFPNNRSAFRRMQSPRCTDETRSIEDRLEFPLSKRMDYGQSHHQKPNKRIHKSDAWTEPDYSSTNGQGVRLTSLKRRLRPAPDFHESFYVERRPGISKPNKSWKRGFEDHQADQDIYHQDAYDDGPPPLKTDPPADSEEYKQQIHRAFLRYCKVLNEDAHQQKRYLEQGNAGSLLCCVCGSLSKQFVDTHSLVTHAYNTMKKGLKTEHLGFHKALCVLMGWNWLMPPETSKVYQSTPVTEAKSLKADLILWPPVVIVHNSSIRNQNDSGEAKVVTVEGLEAILKEMGFGAGKTQVGLGKPSNQSVLLVKFMPTFSGLQEAERLHKHYADNNHGRQEFQQIISSRGSDGKAGEAQVGKAEEELLYGYVAVAEDLGKLDPGTKKRSLVKSRKDIEAIADAPLNAD